MRHDTKVFIYAIAGMVGTAMATTFAVKKDHIRIQQQRQLMGTQAKGPNEPVDQHGLPRWRHQEYHPDPHVRQALIPRRPVELSGEKQGGDGEGF